jgi:hypothetical protein
MQHGALLLEVTSALFQPCWARGVPALTCRAIRLDPPSEGGRGGQSQKLTRRREQRVDAPRDADMVVLSV